MRCYDCYREGIETSAVAVCIECHAGVCPRHLHPESEPVRRSTSTGRVWSARESRRMYCSVCHASLQQDDPADPGGM
ncbi:DUF2180 family protein [Streptomyces sp. NPDC053499]|nr:DUF2180 family protein [Streptomyces sp. 891-h]UNZ16408.1 DUF2180 family protein [Streptomyces sp. 891-h]